MVWANAAARADGPSFAEDVIPLLTRFGCNAGACHGKLAGQNGFRLSLRGFDPLADFESLTREARGRRINLAAPEHSLLLRKAKGEMPHGGGRRIEPGSPAERVLLDWLRAGVPGPIAQGAFASEPRVAKLEVSPDGQTLSIGEARQLRVTAHYDDGHARDVTWLTQFASNDAGMLEVSPEGRVAAVRHGETQVRAAFQGHVAIATFTMPLTRAVDAKWYAARNNAIDGHVFDKLAALRLEPSPLCDDATFIRRAFFDAIGTLPTSREVREFLADARPDKRQRLVEALLNRPEWVDYWALFFSDLLQNRKERDHDVRGAKGVRAFHHWLREQLAANRSWRDIATAVLTASGPSDANPAVGYFIVTVGERQPEESEVADSVAQAFLGTRIGCARCHNHPLERFTQDDYYHFAGFFSRVTLARRTATEGPTVLHVGTREAVDMERDIERERVALTKSRLEKADAKKIEATANRVAQMEKELRGLRNRPVGVRQPRTGVFLAPRPLDRDAWAIAPSEDPRAALVRWMSYAKDVKDAKNPKNELFAGAMVNRLWKHFLGRGLVEPVDDLRATNPPSNRGLWNELNREFVGSGYSLKHLMRFIMNSRAYQLSSETRGGNAVDARFHSHYYARRLPAEVLLDGICQVTGLPETFPGYPIGVRAITVPDAATESYFLKLFGRSERTTACACERDGDVSLLQLLHLQNDETIQRKARSPEGRLAKLLAQEKDDRRVTEESFLGVVSRPPTDSEFSAVAASLKQDRRDEVFADLLWVLLNSTEFTFQH